LFVVAFVVLAQPSQELKPPANPARFKGLFPFGQTAGLLRIVGASEFSQSLLWVQRILLAHHQLGRLLQQGVRGFGSKDLDRADATRCQPGPVAGRPGLVSFGAVLGHDMTPPVMPCNGRIRVMAVPAPPRNLAGISSAIAGAGSGLVQ
jgi:hypothetical protein